MSDSHKTGNEQIPGDVDINSLGKCRRCDCEKFVEENGSVKCGRSTCKHSYQSHGS